MDNYSQTDPKFKSTFRYTKISARAVREALILKKGYTENLIYYPPYHSKYNSVERCWGVLENYWNGAILDTISAALSWASNMTWKGKHPDTYLIENTYDKGITISSSELQFYQQFWQPSENLPKWDVSVVPP